MNTQHSLQELAKVGRELDQLLRRYSAFVDKTVRKYVDASRGGTVNYVAAIISREQRALHLVIENQYDFESIKDGPLDGFQRDALIERKAHYDDLLGFFDEKSHHQLELNKALSDTDGLTKSERSRLQSNVPKLAALIRQFDEIFDGNDWPRDDEDDPENADPNDRRGRDIYDRAPGPYRSQTGGRKMPDSNRTEKSDTVDALNGVVDAISRLQSDASGGYGGSAGSASNAYNLFSNSLDQKIQTTLGMPNLESDGALAMDSDDLLDKLFDGLDRSVVTSDVDGATQFQFNPLKARGSALGSEMNALGAQAVTADHIRALKEPILANLYRLVPENTYSEQDEADDLRRAIEESIDKLAVEASAELGAFDVWAGSLFEQIYRDLFSLAALYGIKTAGELLPFFVLSQKAGDTVEAIFSAIPLNRASARVFKDPDIGILTAEANDKAILAIIYNLVTMSRLLVDDDSLGPLLGRIRAYNDAISASVIAARNGLATAGISIEDQIVSFSDDPNGQENNISLRRLLGWIESESIMSRPVLLKGDLNARDLDRLRAARATQAKALAQIMQGDFTTVNKNRYAVGRRHLAELEEHLVSISNLMTDLIEQSSAFPTKR